VIETPCRTCRGRGRVAQSERVELDVPAGIMDGQRLRLPGRGHAGEPGAPAGDLYVAVAVAPDPRFERDGADLVSVIDVPFTRAALGGTVSVETIEGPEEVDIPAGLQPNQVIVLRGKGVHALGRRGRGDHRLVANVRVPRRLTDEQRRLLERFESSVEDGTYEDQSFFGRLRAALR
jgi:molecular chaperone DnaJ